MSKKVKKPVFTEDEQIRRVWDIEEVKKLMNKRMYYHASDMRREELNDLWVRELKNRKTASLGSNWGWYVGFDEVSSYYVVKYTEERRKLLDAYSKANPEIANTEDNLGYGCMQVHPLSTPFVKLSDDGKTARGIWYSIGQESTGEPDGSGKAMWICQKIAADFIREDDETAGETRWKIWHLVYGIDIATDAGMGYHATAQIKPWQEQFESGEPTVSMLAHNTRFNWSDDWPPVPKDYVFYDPEDTSYAPTGHPKFGGEA